MFTKTLNRLELIVLFMVLVINAKNNAQDLPFFIDTFEEFSYPSSWCFYKKPSNLETVWSRVPIDNFFSHSGKTSLKLHWQSKVGGDWGLGLATTGWGNNNFTNLDSIVFWGFPEKEIKSADLPNLYLEDKSYTKSKKMAIGTYVDSLFVNKWNRIAIPLQPFKTSSERIDITKIRAIFFGQNVSDALEHKLLIDDLIIKSNKVTNGDSSLVVLILGSSTAEGVGANPIDSSWVNRYRDYLKNIDTTYEVVNLGVGGYSSYELMPSEIIPSNDRPFPSVTKNLTYALSFNPTKIIVNLPSNDVALKYSIEEQFYNYLEMKRITDSLNIPLWFCTTQPRNFDSLDIAKQMIVRDKLYEKFPGEVIDFWNGLATNEGTIKENFDSGDGVHVNNKGHRLLFEKVKDSKILADILPIDYLLKRHDVGKSKVDSLIYNMTHN